MNASSAYLIQYPARLFQAVNVPVKTVWGGEVTYDIQKIRCTGGRSFHGQEAREDWVWVRAGRPTEYGLLRGHVPGKLKALFTFKTEEFTKEERLAIIRLVEVEKRGESNSSHVLVIVVEQPDEDEKHDVVVEVKTIVAMAHLIRDQRNSRRWYVNTRIDLWIFRFFHD